MSYQSYYNQVRNAQKANLDADVAALEKSYDGQIKTVEEGYNTQIADTEAQYDVVQKKNELQRVVNQRSVERRMAEMGLTDSGMNRTQQSAVQLSYANQKGETDRQRQKAVDTLAAAMRAKVTELENAKISGKQQIISSYDAEARSQATSMYNAEQSAAAARYRARLEAEQSAANASLINKVADITEEIRERIENMYSDVPGKKYKNQANMPKELWNSRASEANENMEAYLGYMVENNTISKEIAKYLYGQYVADIA